jgi:hypothetical protein
MGDPMENLRGLFDGPPPAPPKPERGVRMVAKTIDGVKYVPLSDVCDLLKLNEVLPGIERKFRGSL